VSAFIRSDDVQHNTLNNSVAVCQGEEKNEWKRWGVSIFFNFIWNYKYAEFMEHRYSV